MSFVLLALLMLACLPDEYPAALLPLGPGESALVTWAGVFAFVGVAELISANVRRQMARNPADRSAIVRRYRRWRAWQSLGLTAVYAAALGLAGWGHAVLTASAVGGVSVPGAEVLLVAPYLLGIVSSWACFYGAERALYGEEYGAREGPFWSRRAYVTFHFRQQLGMVLVPLALLIAVKGLRWFNPAWQQRHPTLAAGVGFAGLALVYISLPWLLRMVLGLTPLPNGPLRTRLMAAARRLDFRFTDVLVWDTRGGVANAMVAGIVPWPRYVILSDRLVEELTHDEVEAVFGHEIGHVAHSHMPYYLGFLVASMIVVAGLWDAFLSLPVGPAEALPAYTLQAREVPLAAGSVIPLGSVFDLQPPQNAETVYVHDLLGQNKDLQIVPFLALLAGYVVVVFGFLSRRCERQADIFGCRAVSCGRPDCTGHSGPVDRAPAGAGLCQTGIGTFISALERVAYLNGISRDRPGWLRSWQHSTIARRVDFLQRVRRDPNVEPRFQRAITAVRWTFVVALAAMLLVLGVAHLLESQ